MIGGNNVRECPPELNGLNTVTGMLAGLVGEPPAISVLMSQQAVCSPAAARCSADATPCCVVVQLPKVAADFLGRALGPLLGTRQQRVTVPGAQQQAAAQQQLQQQQQQQLLQQRRRGGGVPPNPRQQQVQRPARPLEASYP